MDMKAEMGSSRKAMIRFGISFDKSLNKQKQKDLYKWKTEEQLRWDSQEEEQEGPSGKTFPSGSRREGQRF